MAKIWKETANPVADLLQALAGSQAWQTVQPSKEKAKVASSSRTKSASLAAARTWRDTLPAWIGQAAADPDPTITGTWRPEHRPDCAQVPPRTRIYSWLRSLDRHLSTELRLLGQHLAIDFQRGWAQFWAMTIKSALCGLLLLMLESPVFPHSGGLNRDGCHNNRRTGDYHCHRGGVSRPSQQQQSQALPGLGRASEFRNCAEARAAGGAPVYRGQPGYGPHLDRDGDGVGCEP